MQSRYLSSNQIAKIKSDEIIKLYTIEKGKLIAPIRITYQLISPFKQKFLTDDIEFETIDGALTNFLNDLDAFSNWMDLENGKGKEPIFKSFQLIKKERAILTKAKTPENSPYFDQSYPISSEVLFDTYEVIRLLKSNELYEKNLKAAEDLRRKNEENAIKEFNKQKDVIKRNQFEQWKVLEQKRLAGEFDEFE